MKSKTLLSMAFLSFAGSASAADKPLVMVRTTITDVQRNGNQPLATLMVPKGWKTESKIEWTLASLYFPFALSTKHSSPDGSAIVEGLPVVQGRFSASPLGREGTPPPKDALEGLTAIARNLRPQARMKLMRSQASQTTQDVQGVATNLHQTGTITVAYTDGEREIVEEFTGSLFVTSTEMQGYSTKFWAMHNVRSIRADKANFAEAHALGTTISRSARATPEFAKAIEVASQCVANIAQHDRQARQLEQDLWLQVNRECNDAWRKAVAERWAAQDRQNEQLRDILGGVNRFTGQQGAEVLLPQSHKHAWEGPNGTYLLTNDPSYRPDADFSGRWDRMKPKN